jgi:hypothetical protein
LSLQRLGGIFGRTKVFSTTGHTDFINADSPLMQVMEAIIIGVVMAHIRVRSVKEMQTRVMT